MIKNGMAVLTLALVATLVHADDYLSPTNERVRLSLGFMHLSSTTAIQVWTAGRACRVRRIDAESLFGLDRSDFEPKFQAMVRVGAAAPAAFRLFYVGSNRPHHSHGPARISRRALASREILSIRDLSMRSLGITYEYSFVHREKFELAATIGINDTDISARARVSTQTRHVDQREDKAGPFPTLGLDSTYVASKRFYFDARAQYFKVAVDHLDGSLGFYEFAGLYRLRPNVSFALGYTAAKATLNSRQTNESGRFDFDSKGPEFFVRVAF